MTTDGTTLVTAESDHIYVWNFPYRAILSCSPEPDVVQITLTGDERRFLTASFKHQQNTAPTVLVVCRTVPVGEIVYTFEFNVKRFLPIGTYHLMMNVMRILLLDIADLTFQFLSFRSQNNEGRKKLLSHYYRVN